MAFNDEKDPNFEISAIIRKVYDSEGPASLFNEGMRDGLLRMLDAPAALRSSKESRHGRLVKHLAFRLTSGMEEILDKMLSAQKAIPLKSNHIERGHYRENNVFGYDIDLNQLPSPLIHLADGGRYIQTYGMHVVQSPNSKWSDWSAARAMIDDNRHLVSLSIGPRHIWQIHQRKSKFVTVPGLFVPSCQLACLNPLVSLRQSMYWSCDRHHSQPCQM